MFRNLPTETYDREYDNRVLLARIWAYFARYRGTFLVVIVSVTLLALVGALSPVVVALGVESLDTGQGSDWRGYALALLLLLLGLATWG
ncbi:MAG: hypothetical protein ACRC1H_17360, partial [Caldilineaceae bacterium]